MSPLRVDIRDKRLPGGRINISAATEKQSVQERRTALVRDLIDAGEEDALELLRKQKLHIADVQRAYRDRTLPALVDAAVAKSTNGHGKPRTVGAAVDAVLRRVAGNQRAGTETQYAMFGKALKDGLGATTLLRSVTIDQCDAFMKLPRKGGEPWVPTTRSDVRSFARRVWRAGGIGQDGNPWYDVELPKKKKPRNVFLQPAEWQALYAYVEGTPVAAALALACLAGLRISEVCNLRTDIDVDMAARLIRVQERKGAHPWEAKTDNSIANVPMSAELHRILAAHIAAGFAGARYFVIIRKNRDEPLKRNTLEKWTKKAFEGVGIKYGRSDDGLTFHSLRHTFASWMAQKDVQLLKIAKLMRDTPETVARVYAHLVPEDLEEPAELVGRIAAGGEA